MGRGGAKAKGGDAGNKGEDLEGRKKQLEQELKDVEKKLQEQLQRQREALGLVEGKGKGKKEKAPKEKKEKKAKAPKAHPSSKAGPGFTVSLTTDNPPLVAVANINKKSHAFKRCGVREGDVLERINDQEVNGMTLNDTKAKLIASCGTVLHLRLSRPGEGRASFSSWLDSVQRGEDGHTNPFAGEYTAEVILEFGPLVKAIKTGKPPQRGHAAELSLQMADSQMKRELFFAAGALVPLCKLLTDPKAAAQVTAGIRSLQNMLRVSMWDELSLALSTMGKPLVQMVEKGGLAKKMMAMDLLLRIALFAPTHRVLIASGVLEALLALPKGIIPLSLPKFTPKGWKAGKKVTGLEAKAATLVGSLARMDDSTRSRINSSTCNGVEVLVRMMQRKSEPAGVLNDITPEGGARALEALQYTALSASCRAVMERTGAIESIVDILKAVLKKPPEEKMNKKGLIAELTAAFQRADFGGSGSLNAKEFEVWYVDSGQGDSRAAKSAFRECDFDGSGSIALNEVIEYVTRDQPEDLIDVYAAYCMRNLAVSSPVRERLHACGATSVLADMLRVASEVEDGAGADSVRSLVASLALLNMSVLPDCAECLCELQSELTLASLVCKSYSPSRAHSSPDHRAVEHTRQRRNPNLPTNMYQPSPLPETLPSRCTEAGCAAAFVLRRLAVLRGCKSRIVAAEIAARRDGHQAGEGSLIWTLCSMIRDSPVCAGRDAVGNEIECYGASAAVAALQNLLSENEPACALAIQVGAISSLKALLARWIDTKHRAQPPELPSEGEEDSDDEDHLQVEALNQVDDLNRSRAGDVVSDQGQGGGIEAESVVRQASSGAVVGKALMRALVVEESEVDNDSANAAMACKPAVTGAGPERANDVDPGFEALPSEVTWTAQWWWEQRELDACRAAWCLRSLAFRERDLLVEEDVEVLLRRAVRLADDEDTNTACTWALLALQ